MAAFRLRHTSRVIIAASFGDIPLVFVNTKNNGEGSSVSAIVKVSTSHFVSNKQECTVCDLEKNKKRRREHPNVQYSIHV